MPQPRKHTCNAERQAEYRQRQQTMRQEECRQRGLPPLAAVPTMPSYARWNGLLKMVCALLGMLISEMADYADARSETWQQSERGETFAERLDMITQIAEQLDTLLA
jgi:hypothetical protein